MAGTGVNITAGATTTLTWSANTTNWIAEILDKVEAKNRAEAANKAFDRFTFRGSHGYIVVDRDTGVVVARDICSCIDCKGASYADVARVDIQEFLDWDDGTQESKFRRIGEGDICDVSFWKTDGSFVPFVAESRNGDAKDG